MVWNVPHYNRRERRWELVSMLSGVVLIDDAHSRDWLFWEAGRRGFSISAY